MLTLPSKFSEENKKADKVPAILVKLLNQEISNEQTTQADWAANSLNSNVDWTPSPPASGDVILASAAVPNDENQTNNSWGVLQTITSLQGLVTDNVNWQSFKQTTGGAKTLGVVQGYFYKATSSGTMRVSCQIWSAGKASQIGTTVGPTDITSDVGQWLSFDFSSQGIILQNDTEYWIRFNGSYSGVTANVSYHRYQSTNVYSKGQFDRTGTEAGTNLGDLAFIISMTGDYYQASGYIRTQTMDIGEVPIDNGEWIIEDTQPSGTSLAYQAWASDTGAFAGEEVSLGAIHDGAPITVLKRYYRVRADFSATNRSFTPTLQRIKANFDIYETFSDRASLGYEASLMGISALSTTIDTFAASTISQVTLAFGLTPSISGWLASKYPKNKIVKIKAGFIASGFTEADFIDYFWGQVDNWSISKNDEVSLIVKDFKKEWSVNVPIKWQSALDDVVWTNQHHIDVMLDILRNRINVRDSKIDTASFDSVKAALPGWKVTRTITGNPEDANKLLEELRVLTSCFFLPQADGRIRIKRWDSNEAAVDAITDDNTRNFVWEANAGSLINLYQHYYGWDGSGDNASDFGNISINTNPTSQSNWGEAKNRDFKDKWTRPTESSQVTDLSNKIMARYADPPPIINAEVDRSKIYLETGDIVTVSTRRAPSSDMNGISNVKYQIVNRTLDFKNDWIKLKLLRV